MQSIGEVKFVVETGGRIVDRRGLDPVGRRGVVSFGKRGAREASDDIVHVRSSNDTTQVQWNLRPK